MRYQFQFQFRIRAVGVRILPRHNFLLPTMQHVHAVLDASKPLPVSYLNKFAAAAASVGCKSLPVDVSAKETLEH